jgi:hypothetical protein
MRMWLRLGVGIGVLGTLAAVGCSSGPLPNADPEEFCLSQATQECQVATLFCGQPTNTGCISVRQNACMTIATQALQAGRVYTQPNASTCISAVQSAYTDSQVSYMTLQGVTAACEPVFAGSVADGNACTTDFDCANSEVCSPVEPGSSTTVCAVPIPDIGLKMPCADVGSVCATGTYCTGVPAKCEVGGTAGGTCTEAVGCATGAYCQMNAGAKSGKCITAASEGSTCKGDTNCAEAAPYCDLSVTPKGGVSGKDGECELGLSFAVGSDDCKAFGAGS